MKTQVYNRLIKRGGHYANHYKYSRQSTIQQQVHEFEETLKQQAKQESNISVAQRPIGLAKDEFQVPASFFEPLPEMTF